MPDRRIGQAIKEMRLQAGLSLGQLSIKTGISKTGLHKIESGDTASPTLDSFVSILLALGQTSLDNVLIECGILPEPPDDVIWSNELVIMQRVLQHLENLDPEMRQDAGRVVIAQAHAWEQISKLQEPEPSENIQQDKSDMDNL